MNADKKKIIAKYARKEGDTGSPEVQIAVLSAEIKELTEHLKVHKKDHSTRRGLLAKVNRRKTLLEYLRRENAETYKKVVDELAIRHQ